MLAIYTRQSVDKKDSLSIDTQIEFCKRMIDKEDNMKIYTDKGYSGSNINRPALQELKQDIDSGLIEKVFVYKLDRISRSVVDFANLYQYLENHGVEFKSAQEYFDTSTSIGKAMLSITMVFAELERATIQQRIKDNYYARGAKGMYLSGSAPYGFEKSEVSTEYGTIKCLKANEEQANILTQIFTLYVDKENTLSSIAKKLNTDNIPSPSGGVWNAGKVSRVLRNPVCVKANVDVYNYYNDQKCECTNKPEDFVFNHGVYLYGKPKSSTTKFSSFIGQTLTIAPHYGIIEPNVFLRCQARLDENLIAFSKKRETVTWLTGLTKCQKCGNSASQTPSCNGRRLFYCNCAKTYNTCDVNTNLGELREIELLVEQRILALADKYSKFLSARPDTISPEAKEILHKIEETDERIAKIDSRLSEASESTATYLRDEQNKLLSQHQQLEAALNALNEYNRKATSKGVSDLGTNWSTLSISAKNKIAHALIDKILLSPGRIEICWRYDFESLQSTSVE